jgi:hypothetical protein
MAIREVGPGQTYTTITAAIAAATAGDILNIHDNIIGPYTESVTVSKTLTLRNQTGETPVLDPVAVNADAITVTADDVTIDGLEITGWSGLHRMGVTAISHTGLTVRNCEIHDGGNFGTGSGSGVNATSCTRVTIEDNEIYHVNIGARLLACHSTNGTYANGTLVKNNHIHDCHVDGIDIHGEYFTIDGNEILDNIDTDYLATHPDGIQFIAAPLDGYDTASHVIIKNNIIRNHTQNIFAQGTGIVDVQIFNNIVYNDETVVHGVNMAAITTKNYVGSAISGLVLVGNLFGPVTSVSVALSASGTIDAIRNNVFIRGKVCLNVPTPANVAEFEGNWFQPATGAGNYLIIWGTTWFSSYSAFAAAYPAVADDMFVGDPLVGAFPNAVPLEASPLLNNGVVAGASYATDRLGVVRPQGSAWDIGPYEGAGSGGGAGGAEEEDSGGGGGGGSGALVTLPSTNMYWPRHIFARGGGAGNSVATRSMFALGHYVAQVFRVPKSGTLHSFERWCSQHDDPTNHAVRMSFQDINNTTGLPDAGVDQYRVLPSVSQLGWVRPAGPITSDGTDGGTKRVVTVNQLLAAVMDFSSFVNGGVNISAPGHGKHFADPYSVNNGTIFGEPQFGALALKYDDGTFAKGAIWDAPKAIITDTYNVDSASFDEVAMHFTLGTEIEIDGFALVADLDGACDVVLYDANGGVVVFTTMSPAGRLDPNYWDHHPPCTASVLVPGTYYLSLKPTTTTSVKLVSYQYDLNGMLAGTPGGLSNCFQAKRVNGGAWTISTDTKPLMSLRLAKMTLMV